MEDKKRRKNRKKDVLKSLPGGEMKKEEGEQRVNFRGVEGKE